MADTNISWCEKVWNPVTGCTPAGVGCTHCYAARHAKRFWGDRPFSDVRCHPERLDQPMKWRKPREIFVNSMSDLFHRDVPDGFISDVLYVILAPTCQQHTFIVLTKRPERMREFMGLWRECGRDIPKNIVVGVSCSTQVEANRWVPELIGTPAACRVVSLEPLVEAIDLTEVRRSDGWNIDALHGVYSRHHDEGFDHPAALEEHGNGPRLDGVIVGGESGPGARPMHPDWVRSLRDQCAAAGTAFYFKQWSKANEGQWAFLTGLPLLDGRTHDALPWRGAK